MNFSINYFSPQKKAIFFSKTSCNQYKYRWTKQKAKYYRPFYARFFFFKRFIIFKCKLLTVNSLIFNPSLLTIWKNEIVNQSFLNFKMADIKNLEIWRSAKAHKLPLPFLPSVLSSPLLFSLFLLHPFSNHRQN